VSEKGRRERELKEIKIKDKNILVDYSFVFIFYLFILN
jgi:hypothetical protein